MKLFKLDNKMLVFIIIGLSLIFMAVYTYYYVSVNTSAIILIALLVYFPYFLIKTMGNVDFKSGNPPFFKGVLQ